jgi:uncharacterized protein with HEPN domain
VKQKDNLALLLQIRDAVDKLVATRADGKEAFVNSSDAEDATKQRLTAIAIFVPQLTGEMKKRYPSVDWRALAGVLDVVCGGYPDPQVNLLWNFLTGELPVLKGAIDEELQKLQAERGTVPGAH